MRLDELSKRLTLTQDVMAQTLDTDDERKQHIDEALSQNPLNHMPGTQAVILTRLFDAGASNGTVDTSAGYSVYSSRQHLSNLA